MSRYFIEVAYKGTAFSGFQIQQNAVTIQSEVESALAICFKQKFSLTGSSRTDSGVHARQNYFHLDTDIVLDNPRKLYNLNAILSKDIVINKIFLVADTAHCRFDALSRTYKYSIYHTKNPFIKDMAYFYPYPLDISLLQEAASHLKTFQDFEPFSKKNSQVFTHLCTLSQSEWKAEDDGILSYNVTANRFLRGMVKALTGTMLRVGSGRMPMADFKKLCTKDKAFTADFSPPGHGLILMKVKY